MHYQTKDSGQRENFDTGARRDTEAGKPRYDLIDIYVLRDFAELMARGAEKYGDNNWKAGIPDQRAYSSLLRHLMQYMQGDTSEDHMSAVLFNAMVLKYNDINRVEITQNRLLNKLLEVEERAGKYSTITNFRDLYHYLDTPYTLKEFIMLIIKPLIESNMVGIRQKRLLYLTQEYTDMQESVKKLDTLK